MSEPIEEQVERIYQEVEQSISDWLTGDTPDPLETVHKMAEEMTGCECETYYSDDRRAILVNVKLLVYVKPVSG